MDYLNEWLHGWLKELVYRVSPGNSKKEYISCSFRKYLLFQIIYVVYNQKYFFNGKPIKWWEILVSYWIDIPVFELN